MFLSKPARGAIAVAASLACNFTFAQSSNVTMYGILDAGVRYSEGLNGAYAPINSAITTINSGIDTTSRLGFRGTEDLGGGMAATFNLESGVNVATGAQANSTKLFDRAATLGLQASGVALLLGRQTTLLADTNGVVDPLGSRFASFNPNVSIAALSSHNIGAIEYGPAGSTTGAFRLDNSAKLIGQAGDFSVRAMYAFGAQPASLSKLSSSGVSLGYQSGGIAASYAFTNFKTAADLTLKAYMTGLTAMVGGTKLAVTYAASDAQTAVTANTKNKTFGMGATVPLAANVDLVVAHYRLSRNRTGSIDDGFNRTFVFVEYKLSKRSLVYAELDQTAWKNNYQGAANRSNASGMSLGVKHTF